MKRLLLTTVMAIGLGSGGAVLAAEGSASAHEPGTNGCTLAPDVGHVPVYFNFHRSCDRHDLCYRDKPFGDGRAGRKACDDAFRTDMRAWCNAHYDAWWQAPARVTCRGVANVYYVAVRVFGAPYFF
jgi:hypothetical protein